MVRDVLRRIQRMEAKFANLDRLAQYTQEMADAVGLNIGTVNWLWDPDQTGPGTQRLVPVSDISTGTWEDDGGSTPIYSALDDAEDMPDDDTTYAVSMWGWSPNDFDPSDETDTFEVKLGRDDGGSIVTPSVDTGHAVTYRAKREAGPGVDLDVSLYDGATLIASDSTRSLGTSYTDYSFTLTEGEAANITDYTDLRLRFVATLNNDYALPASDISTGSWGSTPLWSKVDDTPSAIDGATTEVTSSTANDTMECKLTNMGDPGTNERHLFWAQWAHDNMMANGRITHQFLQGSTSILSVTHTKAASAYSMQRTQLSTVQAGSITDYSDLRIRKRTIFDPGTNQEWITSMGLAVIARPRVTSAEMELPG